MASCSLDSETFVWSLANLIRLVFYYDEPFLFLALVDSALTLVLRDQQYVAKEKLCMCWAFVVSGLTFYMFCRGCTRHAHCPCGCTCLLYILSNVFRNSSIDLSPARLGQGIPII